MVTEDELRKVKEGLGELEWLDFTRFDLPEAHYHLGQQVSRQVHKILRQRLESQSAGQTRRVLGEAKACQRVLTNKIEDDTLSQPVRNAITEYTACLAAWAEGVGLEGFVHPALVSLDNPSALDLAYFLQHDSLGCQTGMYRAGDGSVILWHTEEDLEQEPRSGFDRLRIGAFRVADGDPPVTMHAFIYPDLLPGPAFGWRSDGYSQAADLLYIKPSSGNSAHTLANIVTWLALRLGPTLPAREVIQVMLPCYDGYALNIVQVNESVVEALKYEFGEELVLPYMLDVRANSCLYQANIFTDGKNPRVKEIEDLLSGERAWFERRVAYTTSAIKHIPDFANTSDMIPYFHSLLCSQVAGGGSYANKDVKAYFIYRQTLAGAEIRVGHGPALPEDTVTIINITS